MMTVLPPSHSCAHQPRRRAGHNAVGRKTGPAGLSPSEHGTRGASQSGRCDLACCSAGMGFARALGAGDANAFLDQTTRIPGLRDPAVSMAGAIRGLKEPDLRPDYPESSRSSRSLEVHGRRAS
ncbi:hypothetical protein LZ30DRAFT_427443 [Colletotrichum cereale]|nr:hypothetical protein LZ30DRAFT_427443 [Colletotrichum cereale]